MTFATSNSVLESSRTCQSASNNRVVLECVVNRTYLVVGNMNDETYNYI